MATNFSIGTPIGISGLGFTGLRAVAEGYVRQNAASIGAKDTTIARALEIAATRPQEHAGKRDATFAWILDQRVEALRGKSGEEAREITRTYDLVLGYYGVQMDIIKAQQEGGSRRGYTLPSLDNATWDMQSWNAQAASQRAQAVAKREADARTEETRRNGLTPYDLAVTELTERHHWSDARRDAAKSLLTDAFRNAEQLQVAPGQRINNVREYLKGRDVGMGTTDADRATQLLDRSLEIAAARNAGTRIFVRPSAAPAAPAAEAPAANSNTPAPAAVPTRSVRAEAKHDENLALNDDALIALEGNLLRGLSGGALDRAVRDLQQSLDRVSEGGLNFGADGIYGAATEGAVKALQEKYGLATDGIAGRQTITALQVEEARFLIDRLKEGGLTDAEKTEIQKELADVQQVLQGQTNIAPRVLEQLTGALDGLKAATGGNDVTEGALATTVAALRQATTPGRES